MLYVITFKLKEMFKRTFLLFNFKMDGFKIYEGKNVYIILKNNRAYSGKVLEVENKGSCSLIIILDKFGKRVAFYDTEILVMEEELKGVEDGKRSTNNN